MALLYQWQNFMVGMMTKTQKEVEALLVLLCASEIGQSVGRTFFRKDKTVEYQESHVKCG